MAPPVRFGLGRKTTDKVISPTQPSTSFGSSLASSSLPSSSLFLSKQEASDKPIGQLLIFIGPPGSGKTTLCSQSGGIFVYHEDDAGVVELYKRNLIPSDTPILSTPYNSPQKLLDLIEIAANQCETLGRHTVIIESLTTIYAVWAKHCIATYYNGNTFEFNNYGSGTKKLLNHATYVPALVDVIAKVRRRGLNVILTAHCNDKTKPDTKTGIQLETTKVQLPDTIFNVLAATAQLVGVFSYKVDIEKMKGGKTRVEEGAQGITKYLAVARDAFSDAKNWFGVNDPIDLDKSPKENWDNFCSACRIHPKTLQYVSS